jgi:hypothetical protein
MNRTEPKYYSPSAVSTIANAAIADQEFRGLSADLFAFNKINIGCDDPSKLNLIKVTAKLDEGRKTIFSDVHLLALQRLLKDRTLLGGFLIEASRKLVLSVTNNSGAQRVISIDLNGYDAPQYHAKVEKYEERGHPYPEPEFLYATATIQAGAVRQRVPINIPESATNLYRIAISSTSDDNLQVAFKVDNKELIPNRFVSAINDQFVNKEIVHPFLIDKRVPFEAQITNLDGANNYEISIICEAYKV